MKVICHYCDKPATLVSGAEVYPKRGDLFGLKFWQCLPCGAHVGCHRPGKGQGDGSRPLGRLANAELRKAKSAAHAAFDPLWVSRAMKRKDAYAWLAQQMGISADDCHIGMFDVDQCRAVVTAVKARGAA